nr:MAG TPA: hypothetical protein [Caudoviricetes sp.]
MNINLIKIIRTLQTLYYLQINLQHRQVLKTS